MKTEIKTGRLSCNVKNTNEVKLIVKLIKKDIESKWRIQRLRSLCE